MANNNRSTFKLYCPDSFQRMKTMAKHTDPKRCTIDFNKKFIVIKVEDPHNNNGFLTFEYKYEPNVETKLQAKLDEIDDILRTIYQPLYITLIPLIKTQLKSVNIEYNDASAYLKFAYDHPEEPFGYNYDEYKRFISYIGDLLLQEKEGE